MENLKGKKVRGFKFESKKIIYSKVMDKHIGEIGEIVEIHSNSCKVQFKDDWWGYPLSEIQKHLVDEIQPFEKVWAWDNIIKDEIQTYYIKKVKDGYMVVTGASLRDYENEHSFNVVRYDNISRTKPNQTPNDVIKLIEKYGDDKLITLIESYKN